MRMYFLTMLVSLCSVQAWAQGEIYADGFELGHACRWSQEEPTADCSGAEITVYLPGDVPLTLVRIPSGTFWMGSPSDERRRLDQEDLHQVTLTNAYFIGKYEVTQAQWQAVMGTNPALGWGEGPDYPVYYVSWDMIAGPGGFIDTLNAYLGTTEFRLPTEAEWERAARAGTQTTFSFGDDLSCSVDADCSFCSFFDQYMWWCGNDSPHGFKPVGSKFPNGFGLFDVHGNIEEFVADWFISNLGADPVTDPAGPITGSYRVLRGGRGINYARYCRSASRSSYWSDAAANSLGFRLARTAP